MKLIMFGPPGAGKGTQTDILCRRYGIQKISTGDALREVIRSGSELGQQVKGLMDQGKFVPDEIVTEIIRDRVSSPDCANGFILDGFPRNLAQAEALLNMGIRMNKALLINVPDEVLVERVQGRVVCSKCGASYHVTNNPPQEEGVCDKCGGCLEARSDDRPETVRARLKTYHELTDPVVDFYRGRGILSEIDGTADIETATAEILKILEG
ncbi:MAG: adenylate kinase [Angelakisella sp.]|nr:adenylate kinase [Angelakisella sp.]